MAVANGNWQGGEIPKQVVEFLFAKTYGWSLEYIRSLSTKDLMGHIGMLMWNFQNEANKGL